MECIYKQTNKQTDLLGINYKGLWIRNYKELFKKNINEDQIKVTKITKEMWPEQNWKTVGAFIEVDLKKKNENK